MSATPDDTVVIDPGSEVARALTDAGDRPVRLVVGGVRYRVRREQGDDPWAGYDAERVRAALREFAGSVSPEEAERMQALVRRGREEGTRPPDRP